MPNSVCKYCGREVKPRGNSLVSDLGANCQASSNKKHVLLSNPPLCVFCGRETKIRGNALVTAYGSNCYPSPTKKHLLQE